VYASELASLGWSAFFLAQLHPDEVAAAAPARIATVHRTRLAALSARGPTDLAAAPGQTTGDYAVGDWVLTSGARVVRRLERRSLIARRAAGTGAERQLIAANVDTLFVVTSCNADFNIARLERYLALAAEAGCAPVVILTRADQADPSPYVAACAGLRRDLPVLALDARSPDAGAQLADWCGPGQTVALAGSSGTGKSTLMNSLAGTGAKTQAIRESDARGRHTTTFRALRPVPGGGWIIDTPGMRELRLADAGRGIAETFAEIEDLALACRFHDCRHETEPGCAVRTAIEEGMLDPRRLMRWRKLVREDLHNSATLAEARARQKAFGRVARRAMRAKEDRRRGEGP